MPHEMPRLQSSSTRGSPPRVKRFHHGSLRQALLDAALVAPDIEGLSLNQLAAGVGVTPAAIYKHFASREDLLGELASIGFNRLEARFAEVFEIDHPPKNKTDAQARLEGLAQAYLQFADDEHALWHLMFGSQAAAYRATAQPLARRNSYDYLPAVLAGLHRCGVVSRAPDERDALFAWSAIHGTATLRAGRVPAAVGPISGLAHDVAKRVIRSLC